MRSFIRGHGLMSKMAALSDGASRRWYTFETRERYGKPGVWRCRATDTDDAMRRAWKALSCFGEEPIKAEYDKHHIENRIRDSVMKIYCGLANNAGCTVHVLPPGRDQLPLDLKKRRDLRDYSERFGWGTSDLGCTQLALALLADALQDDDRALWLFHDFERTFISRLRTGANWQFCENSVIAHANERALRLSMPAREGVA